MSRQHLTDDLVSMLAFTEDSTTRYEVFDASVTNLAIRVGSKKKSFVLVARFAADGNSTRRLLGRFPEMDTEAARRAAHKWNKQIVAGTDPAIEAAEAKSAEALRLRSTFASVMRDYIEYLPSRERNLSAARDIHFIKRNILNPKVNSWMSKPISMVDDSDVASLVRIHKARAPSAGFKCFSVLKTFFRWAMDPEIRKKIGLGRNPIESLTAKNLRLRHNIRERVFEYEEVLAFLRASTAMPYPYGPCLRALFETGQRIGAVAAMRRSQLNLIRKTWSIPGPRSRHAVPGRTAKFGELHVVPLSDNMVAMLRSIVETMPPGYDFVFSFTGGQTPIGSFGNLKRSKSKKQTPGDVDLDIARGRFDRLMREILEELGIEYEPWVWHDVRRTVRTHLEPITGREEVAETAIGHGKQGVVRVYNLYTYRAEIRRGFNEWSDLLRKIENGTCTIGEWEHDKDANAGEGE